MPGTVLENLSGRKLSVLVGILIVVQIACFLLGFLSPSPANSQAIIMRVCLDTERNASAKWFTTDCPHQVDLNNEQQTKGITADQLVFVAKMPLHNYDFSRWQQNLVGILQFEVVNENDESKTIEKETSSYIDLTIDARLAYSNRYNPKWTLYAESEEKRQMHCQTVQQKSLYHNYECQMVPLFELGSLHHDYYLLNMRLPQDAHKNTNLQRITEAQLFIVFMNGGFTYIWLTLKSIFFPILFGIMVWYWRRVYQLARTPALLECMLMTVGGALLLLNAPIEYLTLSFDMPYMLLCGDIRQGVFYASLLTFWLVFAGEHMLVQDHGAKNSLRMYWKHLSTVLVGCVSLLIFDGCERGVQLANPFHSVWVSAFGTNMALAFIYLAAISAALYFLFLCYMVWVVFRNISVKRTVLPSMSQARRLHYEGIIYRFNFLMLATLVCAALTVCSFVLSQVVEGPQKWSTTTPTRGGLFSDDDNDDDDNYDGNSGGGGEYEMSAALHMGVYGMWNVYICAMLMLYAPSHKRWNEGGGGGGASAGGAGGGGECAADDGVEFDCLPVMESSSGGLGSASEISALTSFASKASIE